jgi:DNA-binding MarR family transcriptional regulator
VPITAGYYPKGYEIQPFKASCIPCNLFYNRESTEVSTIYAAYGVKMAQENAQNSIDAMAEEIFALTIIAWKERLRSRRGRAEELSEAQFLTLESLVQKPDNQTVGDILRTIAVAPAQMSRIIRSLEEDFDQPLVACELNREDRRKIDVTITDYGRRLYEEFRDSRLARTRELLTGLSEADRSDFIRVCGKMRELYKQ